MSARPALPLHDRAQCLALLAAALPPAQAAGELMLHYQPQVCLHTGQMLGAEALLRWQSPVWGAVPPDLFVAAAEAHGQIGTLGLWVLEQACRQVVLWQSQGLAPPRVAVNLSPLQLLDERLLSQVEAVLRHTGAEAYQLGIEVTESASMTDPQRAAEVLGRLRSMGFEIALDNFGTGHSSLSCLRSLPVDVVKIDRSLISDMGRIPEAAAVTRSVISMAHALRLRALAEGVETEAQLSALLSQGCDQIQGYWFSRPVPPDELGRQLQAHHALAEEHTHRRGQQRVLLLVDDEPHIRSALTRLFRRDGYKVVTAESGDQGLQRLAEHAVDVIVSDQRMPGMTGVEFLRQAKVLQPDTVRMTLSGYTDLQSIIDAVNEGAVYKFLTKPWDDTQLRSHVAEAFRHKEMTDENRRLQVQVAETCRAMAEVNERLSALLALQVSQTDLLMHSADGMRGLLDNMPLGVIGIDPDGLLAQVNDAARALMPGVDLALGDLASPWLVAHCATLRTQGAGLPVHLPDLQCRLWHQTLTHPDGSPRGDLLIVVPDPET